MRCDPLSLIDRYYEPGSRAHAILVAHGRAVADLALALATRVGWMQPDLAFIEEAALVHDIGIFLTDAPKFDCHGTQPYVCHGVLGRQLLEDHGLPAHALVCERHVGAGICAEEIRTRNLPLPLRNMVPVSVEEQLLCYADKFFSKKNSAKPHSLAKIRRQLAPFGPVQAARFEGWARLFGQP